MLNTWEMLLSNKTLKTLPPPPPQGIVAMKADRETKNMPKGVESPWTLEPKGWSPNPGCTTNYYVTLGKLSSDF